MRLLDKVIASPARVQARDALGLPRELTGVGSQAANLSSCPLRYVVDEEVSRQCFELIRSDNGLLDPENELLRLPAEQFWVEWFGERRPADPAGHRLGALVTASADGRSGTVLGYWENRAGQADFTVLSTEFDLDAPATARGEGRLKIDHASLPHLDELFRYCAFQLDRTWEGFLKARGADQYRRELRGLAEAAWMNLPFVLAFSAMMNSRDVLDQTPSDLDRLNRARRKHGRPELLEHIHVTLRLGAASTMPNGGGASGRHTPRLHHVRGHLVQRAGKTFWRSPHLRGDGGRPILTKTVRVTAAAVNSRPSGHGSSPGVSTGFVAARAGRPERRRAPAREGRQT